MVSATPTYCCGSPHGHCSTDPGCQVANQYGWPFPYGSLYRAEPHAPLLGGGAEEFNNWNSPWWRPSPVDAEPSDMVSCLEQSESWAKMTNGEFSLLNWFLNSYSGQSCSYTFLHVWMFHKVFLTNISLNNVYVEGSSILFLNDRQGRRQIQNWLPKTLDPQTLYINNT